jgi:anti-sigma B factor antagonist
MAGYSAAAPRPLITIALDAVARRRDNFPVADHRASLGSLNPPQVITMPAEIDLGNSGRLGDQVRAAFRPGASVVIADLTPTTFCDTSGARVLVLASKEAAAADIELRLAVPEGNVRRMMRLLGLDHVLRLYPSLADALVP